ncbi:MAG: hypothetical protein K2R98_05710 [Gemmataceae bacterium]|nr:hypothetical protein [Gemmataceae bacterium]
MLSSLKLRLAAFALLLVASGAILFVAADKFKKGPAPNPERVRLMKTYTDGNYKDAYDGLRKLAMDPKCDPIAVSKDLETGIACLQQLGRDDEIDEFREAVIEVHGNNWRLLHTSAKTYLNVQHHGAIVANKFYRGNRRGGDGRHVNAYPRDRVRALQLMQQGMNHTDKETDKKALAEFYLHFADQFMGAADHESWRLQYLTDINQLPDYEDGDFWNEGINRGAPVDEQGKAVFHFVPKSYEDAKSDGERWRWMLIQAAEYDPARASEIDMLFAGFLRSQFGVQTMAFYGWGRQDENRKDESGTFALHTLNEEETIARLASGIKRFPLADEFNWIKIYQRVIARGKSSWGEQARDAIAQEYSDRRQYVKAAAAIRDAIQDYGPGQNARRQKLLEQIVGNWGRFEPGQIQAAGKPASVDFRFRNGDKVAFEAYAIDVPKLLDDVKEYLRGNPARLDHQKLNIADVGHRLVQQGDAKYLGEKVAAWEQNLQPRPEHVDDRITVTTPLKKPGAYLLRGQMANGNLSRVIVWVADTVITKKPLEGQAMYYVADALNGAAVPKAEMEFFGWRQVHFGPGPNDYRVDTTGFKETTNDDGQAFIQGNRIDHNYQWLIVSRKPKAGPDGADRFAYIGFTGIWFGHRHDAEYHQTKVFAITDRPVYRPEQKVNYKFWVRHAKYDEADTSSFAKKAFNVYIHNPKGEKIHEQAFTTDDYGGLTGEFTLPTAATLGMYSIQVGTDPRHIIGHTVVRVEEYKKPEYEVTVEAPKQPVRLGETVTATIQAKYYFGAPVTRGKVKYKVMRTAHNSNWYPGGMWDWFYGPGYWWFATDYRWYPGWRDWGCSRPIPWWYQDRSHQPPELVTENEVEIGPDGTVKVLLDTLPAKALHGDEDHEYTITAEVVDESRRTIVGTGSVLVARKPFQVYTWVDRGHYRVGDTVQASFSAQRLDRKAVEGQGELTLYQVTYNDKAQPVEKAVQTWKLDTNVEGQAQQQIKASQAGQYRLSYKLTDSKKNTIEGAYVFVVRGEGVIGKDFRFNDIELTTDKREYAPGEKVKLLINTDRADSTVLLFVRPANGVYLPPKVLRLQGKSIEQEIDVAQRDMPNFFIEAMTISNGKVHSETREVVVPPEKRVVNVEVLPSLTEYKPGQKATVKVKLTDLAGNPFVGSMVLSIYDKSVEYISGGSNVPEIRSYFWKWRRHHNVNTESNLGHIFGNLLRQGEVGMTNLGVFGALVIEEHGMRRLGRNGRRGYGAQDDRLEESNLAMDAAPQAAGREAGDMDGAPRLKAAEKAGAPGGGQGGAQPGMEPAVRKNFADTAYWNGTLTSNAEGIAEVSLTMPENLTAWKIKAWAMGHGTRVGSGEVEVVTKKDLLVRLQAPRFFVQKDEVVLSGNVHNYLKTAKEVTVTLELEGNVLYSITKQEQRVVIPAGGEKRIDWRVRVNTEGVAVVRMKAVTDEESDAVQMSFPSYVHGMLKTDSFSGVVRPDRQSADITYVVPEERRINESRLEVRYSPTLAGAMVDALPYMVDYPYGCTEQTLNRFVPTVITQRILKRMNLDLKAIEEKRTNLNAQEIGDDKARAKGWKRYPRNPVFNEAEVQRMTEAGVARLAAMHLSDGGWGWFSGYHEQSYPHTTAVVVHGLQLAKQSGVALPHGMLERGIEWLKRYQAQQIQLLQNAPSKKEPYKTVADNLDAMVTMILVDAGISNEAMRDFLYRDRTQLAVYAKAMFGLALHHEQQADKLAMIVKNIEQYVVQDDENQTAHLKLPGDNYWWNWYGSENEANAYYLKLLARTNPKDEKASRLVKYLLNNRKNSTYWTNTRDTAVCIEAMAEYLVASGEDKPDMTVEVWLDGEKKKEVKIDAGNLFTFDNQFVLFGDAVEAGKHKLEIKRKGTGPIYFNAYVTNFTLEDHITKAGLEIKVNRKYYKLTRVDKEVKVSGSRGQAVGQKVEKYQRTELTNLAELKSGDLVEVELEIDSKNDYEYILFEDPKAAGFEPMLLQSGYNPNDMGAYMELRDEKVCFFVRALTRGKHSVSYRLRAEIPGKFSALPTRASAMYAPELKANSDEIKLSIKD